MTRILYIEDEALLGQIVQESLASRGYSIDWYTDGRDAGPALANADHYDIAILDVMLPGEDGFVLGQRLRERYPQFPIIYLTARTQSKDVVTGFQAGANDYLRKPFSMEELIVRVENQLKLRRPSEEPETKKTADVYYLGAFSFHYHRLELTHASGEPPSVQLSHREGELLRYFAERLDQTVERTALLKAIWEDDSIFNSRTLDVYVRKLRQYLAADSRVKIITLRGVGYRVAVSTS